MKTSRAHLAAARSCEELALELEAASRHARVAAGHFRDGEVPRAAAHVLAATGHVTAARELLDAVAKEHAKRARL